MTAAAALVLSACAQTVPGHGNHASGAPSSSATASPAPSSSTSASGPTQQPVTFSDCSNILNVALIPVPSALTGKITFGCARLTVPLDYAQPTGKTITLELVKVHDSDNHGGLGSLLVNPGGPGGSGVELALGLVGQIPAVVLTNFDLIGFDPRGVGLSSPVSCISNAEKDRLDAASPDVLTPAGFQQAKVEASSVAQGCSAKYGPALADINTVNTAKDMDLIRQAVGDQQMNYLGFSYGTELGSVYAHLFPDKIRVAVLDGAVDPLTGDIASFADQLRGFEGAFDQFAADCVTHSPCSALRDPRKTVYAIVTKADAAPLATGQSRRLTSSLALTGVLQALYSRSDWPTLAGALIAAAKGDGKGLLALADQYNQRLPNGTYTNIMDANTTISCNDSKPGPSDPTIHATAAAWVKQFPMFGRWAAISLFSCQQWQPVRTPPPLPTAPTPTKALVIGNLHDPATPYQGAKDLAKTMGNAELLSWDGEGHTSYLQGSSCVDNYVDAYLVEQKLPPVNLTCPR